MKRLYYARWAWVLLGATLVVLTANAVAIGKDNGLKKWEVQIGLRTGPEYSFSNFPAFMRAVPIHKDDGYLSSHEYADDTLPNAHLSTVDFGALDLTVHYYVSKPLAVGLIYTFHSTGKGLNNPSYRIQQNQFGNTARGVGTSLRFYQPCGNSLYQFGLSAEIHSPWLKPLSGVWFQASAGGVYDLTGFLLKTKAGWDRYDSDETWKKDDLARLYEHRLTASLSVGFPLMANNRDVTGTWGFKFSYLYPMYDLVWKNTTGTVFEGQTSAPRWEISFFYMF